MSIINKPANCTCSYPEVVMRNMNGHSDACPVYIEWAEKHEHNSQPAGSVDAAEHGRFVAACVWCGQKVPVMLYPHKKDGSVVGFVFVCAKDEVNVKGVDVTFERTIVVHQSTMAELV